MILVLAGTIEGRKIAEKLTTYGIDFLATTISQYGSKLLKESKAENILTKALSEEELKILIKEKKISLIIDATHPYAEIVSLQAIKVAKAKQIDYVRLQRPSLSFDREKVMLVSDACEATEKLLTLRKRAFLSTGSKTLDIFIPKLKANNLEVIVRLLPDPMVIKRCYELGLGAKDIIAMQGPFSKEMNLLMLKESKAEVLVTKDSGTEGGTDTKLLAAEELGIPVILIERPKINYGQEMSTVDELMVFLKTNYLITRR